MSTLPTSPSAAHSKGGLIAIRRWVTNKALSLRSFRGKLLPAPKNATQSTPGGSGEISLFNNARNTHIEGGMTVYISPGPGHSGITLVDAAGREYQMPMALNMPYDVFYLLFPLVQTKVIDSRSSQNHCGCYLTERPSKRNFNENSWKQG